MVNKMSQKFAFSTCCVDNAIVNASGDGNAKSPPPIGSRARWERGMALAAAVSPLAAANRGGESGLHGDAIFYFVCLCEIFVLFVCSLYDRYLSYVCHILCDHKLLLLTD